MTFRVAVELPNEEQFEEFKETLKVMNIPFRVEPPDEVRENQNDVRAPR